MTARSKSFNPARFIRTPGIAVLLTAALATAGCNTLAPHPSQDRPPLPVQAEVNSLPDYLSPAALSRIAADRISITSLRKLLSVEQQITQHPLVDGNNVSLLLDGPATFAAIYAAMAQAREEILVEFFILADDEIGQTFAQKLRDAATRGVAVKVIYDALGSLSTSDDYANQLREAGVEIHAMNPPLEEIDKINNRNHRKLVVVDNSIAILGGVNVTRAYASSSATKPGREEGLIDGWRDTAIEIVGPVVDSYRNLFQDHWVQALGQAPLPHKQPESSMGDVLVRPLHSNGGDGYEFSIYQAYLNAINNAERRIWLTHAYFSPNEAFLKALEDAAQRGVDIRLILPGFIDFDIIYHASRANYHRLLRAGIRIYERTDALLHSKTAVVDGLWSTVGSANLDVRSFIHNDEVNAVIIDAKFGATMETTFSKDLAQAREITLDDWRDRGVFARIKEFFARRLNYFL